jgi:hypothetical protein
MKFFTPKANLLCCCLLIPNGCRIYILDDECIQTYFLDRGTCYFHLSKFVWILVLILNSLYSMSFQKYFYKCFIIQGVQVYITSKTNFFKSKHDFSKMTSMKKKYKN